jgi:hypothetical protein
MTLREEIERAIYAAASWQQDKNVDAIADAACAVFSKWLLEALRRDQTWELLDELEGRDK